MRRVPFGGRDAASQIFTPLDEVLEHHLLQLWPATVASPRLLVSRDEFEAVKAMAAKARSEQEDLQVRVARLESRLAALETPASRTTADSPDC